jgi:hypothetical protein
MYFQVFSSLCKAAVGGDGSRESGGAGYEKCRLAEGALCILHTTLSFGAQPDERMQNQRITTESVHRPKKPPWLQLSKIPIPRGQPQGGENWQNQHVQIQMFILPDNIQHSNLKTQGFTGSSSASDDDLTAWLATQTTRATTLTMTWTTSLPMPSPSSRAMPSALRRPKTTPGPGEKFLPPRTMAMILKMKISTMPW